ncbi:DNA-3-methyladenine glycosylase [Ruminococcaceae bacterium OttesenSCG-928-N02]|nr:DNA-3-methyladenine glycosylase [Ruminococcaceae bacterium OttesenSCG-928-N02]
MNKVQMEFFAQDVLTVAPALLHKVLVHRTAQGEEYRLRITEVEAYRGEEDTACHARAGKTARTAIMYGAGGYAYIYLCYGIHHLFNVVTGPAGMPQAALVRGGVLLGRQPVVLNGPGKLTKAMGITTGQNGCNLLGSELWLEEETAPPSYTQTPRIGIGYAAQPYKSIPWRFVATGANTL